MKGFYFEIATGSVVFALTAFDILFLTINCLFAASAAAVLCQRDILSSGYLFSLKLMFYEVTHCYFFLSLEKKTQQIFFLPREINPILLCYRLAIKWASESIFTDSARAQSFWLKPSFSLFRLRLVWIKRDGCFDAVSERRAASLHFLPAQVVLLFRYDGGDQAHHGSFKNKMN